MVGGRTDARFANDQHLVRSVRRNGSLAETYSANNESTRQGRDMIIYLRLIVILQNYSKPWDLQVS